MKKYLPETIKKSWLSAKKGAERVVEEVERESGDIFDIFMKKLKILPHLLKKLRRITLRNVIFTAAAVVMLCVGGGLLWFATVEIPDLASFDQRVIGQSTKIFDRTGKVLLYDLSKNMRRTVIPFEEISPSIKQATLAIEDNEFYNHHGFRFSSFMRAVIANISTLEFSQGGSTITQQVIKNSLLTKKKSPIRKAKEIFLAIKLERTLTKDEIFSLYLNETSYGGTIYGVEEASLAFFGKSARDVTLAEAAYLAAIPQAPTYYSPYGSHKDALIARKNLVLSKMKEYNRITEEEYNAAMAEEVVFSATLSNGIKAPHFVMYIQEYLEEQYGDRALGLGGLKVITTLDYEMQKKAEEIVERRTRENAKNYQATNAGLVAIDPNTGQILTMVGSRDYFDEEIDGNFNVTLAKRQPGSSFKPIVYAAAFMKGYTPETVLFDVETQFGTKCSVSDTRTEGDCYSPGNYDGRYRGPMTLRNALAQSINIPAVKLLYLVGINDAISLAKQMGITTLTTANQYGLSLVLGGGEVTLLDMVGAYSVFAANGVKHPTTGILEIKDNTGMTVEEYVERSEQVLSKEVALTISDILTDNVARTPVFGANSSLYYNGRDVAAKTGTTNNYRDAWVIGYTPQLTVGAWTGNNDNTPIQRQVAGFIVAPMWHEFFAEILKDLPPVEFETPPARDTTDLQPVFKGDWQNGILYRGETATLVPGVHSILYWIDKDEPLAKKQVNPFSDPQFERWEYAVQRWAQSQGIGVALPPTEGGGETSTELSLAVSSPQNGGEYETGANIVLSVRASSPHGIDRIEYRINSAVIGTVTQAPYSLSIVLNDSTTSPGKNFMQVTAYDKSGAKRDVFTEFTRR